MSSTTSTTSTTSSNRITGLATGLDVDSIVKASMQTYQTKIDKQTQQKDILEIKQKLYRDLMDSANTFYNKYLDITKSDSILYSKNYTSVSFESDNEGVVTATGVGAEAKVDNYTVNVTQVASGANTTLDYTTLKSSGSALSFTYNGKTVNVDISKATDNASLANIINTSLSSINMKATYSQFAGGVVVETKSTGSDQSFTAKVGTLSGTTFTSNSSMTVTNGTNLNATITNSKGQTVTYDDATNVSKSNTVTIDGVQFSVFTKGTTTITGKSDVSALKDKIVSFVKDYNALMEKMNKLLNDTRDRDYQPLTAAQKEEMTEDQITQWNTKVETGQLRGDDYITKISNSLRNSTSDLVSGSSLYLEKIGITPSQDYGGNEIGTFTIDETKLTEALQDNPDGVMKLFIGRPDDTTGLSDTEIYNQSGIFYRMKDIMYDEFVSSSSSLSKKAGLTNSSTFSNNEITLSISKYETKIKEMQTDFNEKEQTLYTKYANLETVINNYNQQQSYLTSQFSAS